MAQERFITHREPVESFPLSEKSMGILKPGRYSGFDVMQITGGNQLTFSHSGRVPKTGEAGTVTTEYGAMMMPTGIVIHDTNDVVLTVGPRSLTGTGVRTRYTGLVCEHNYQPVEGGVPATYFLVQGGELEPDIIPTLPNPSKQIMLGLVKEVYDSLGNVVSLTWEPNITPLPGDMDDTQLFSYLQTILEQNFQGEANIGQNVGELTGVGIYDGKSGETLRFKKIQGESGIVITLGPSNGSVPSSVVVKTNRPWLKDFVSVEISNPTPTYSIDKATILTAADIGRTIMVAGSKDIIIPADLPEHFQCTLIKITLPGEDFPNNIVTPPGTEPTEMTIISGGGEEQPSLKALNTEIVIQKVNGAQAKQVPYGSGEQTMEYTVNKNTYLIKGKGLEW